MDSITLLTTELMDTLVDKALEPYYSNRFANP
jgi:hypothetical protein